MCVITAREEGTGEASQLELAIAQATPVDAPSSRLTLPRDLHDLRSPNAIVPCDRVIQLYPRQLLLLQTAGIRVAG